MEGSIITPVGLSALVALIAFLLVVTAATAVVQTIMEWRVLKTVREVKREVEHHDRVATAEGGRPWVG